jgi:hypothetical protein
VLVANLPHFVAKQPYLRHPTDCTLGIPPEHVPKGSIMTRTRSFCFASIVASLLMLAACTDSTTEPSSPALHVSASCEIQGGNSRSC